ncbi:unnamed protein product [Clavelina lepadiformis]|uniref:Uncharacterized protein n=1 Tax=Clavelina lepadiformis TaxID=159417 RepID=A0ABP0F2V6_CLALP
MAPPYKFMGIFSKPWRKTCLHLLNSNADLSGLPTSPVETAGDIEEEDIYWDALTDIPPIRTTRRGHHIHLPKRF